MSHLVPEQSAQARILDPRSGTIVGYDSHLTAITDEGLNRESIAAALAHWNRAPASSAGDGNRFAGRSIRQAAVLIGLVQRQSGIHVVLTQRASHLRDHAGQIAFPGGAMDASDRDAWHTAQREAWEEIGLPSEQVQFLGRCHTYTTVTAFEVTPCVAWIDAKAVFKPELEEVAQVFELPLSHVLNPANHQQRRVTTPVGGRTFYAIPSLDCAGVERFVWGATAGMLRNLYATLAFSLAPKAL
jgi:8-oxo-dGTP pyrophosphatase MutT (NUDIX family)